ncbi:hypothetical protein [Tissierella creatinophila]|uniref:Uncharacterized protein n=1 Tax=Tissierella creatinophila DSM 6911 TaxID=1123403 RepID=A0A1U7M5M5_TISCR|nr:hypothetical protein [Tissierella creatinophila]OLS02585.1 hypothetical protein TICRE_13860 [Tissierella creatinophila DSM 6911]
MDKETIAFIKDLKKYRRKIPKHQLKTIRGQALSGNLEGAKLGLKKISKERIE